MEVKWETHNGKNILIVDYSGIILDEDMIAHLNKAVAELKEVKKGEKLRFFSNVTGCFATPGFLEAAKRADKDLHTEYTTRSAIMGITGAKAILLNAYNLVAKTKVVQVQSKMEAMEYLSKE
jgi:hypothetical protein